MTNILMWWISHKSDICLTCYECEGMTKSTSCKSPTRSFWIINAKGYEGGIAIEKKCT